MPTALRESKAAAELDMPVSEFRALVDAGVLPRPVRIGGLERWRMVDIEAILSGSAAIPDEDIEL